MANNYIAVTVSANRLGSSLMMSVQDFVNARDRLAQLKNDMDNMISGTDYSVVESAFGVPTGKGQILYNLVAGAVSEVGSATNLNNLLNWLAASR